MLSFCSLLLGFAQFSAGYISCYSQHFAFCTFDVFSVFVFGSRLVVLLLFLLLVLLLAPSSSAVSVLSPLCGLGAGLRISSESLAGVLDSLLSPLFSFSL